MAHAWCTSHWPYHWISEYLSTISYSTLISGSPYGFFKPTCGIRQDDPLSPFLFTLATEAISRLFHKSEALDNFQGVKISRGSPSFNHLLFVDDLFVFAKATNDNLQNALQVLTTYQNWSEQLINKAKSSIFFSWNMPNRLGKHYSSLLGLRKGVANSKYLGLPLHIQRAKTATFEPIIERVTDKLASWKAKSLSQASKGVLIKTVAPAIPSYTMGTFLLPKTICQHLDSIISNFWWGHNPSGSPKLHLRACKALCCPKNLVGLGFRELHHRSRALMVKHAWDIIQGVNWPHIHLLKASYLIILLERTMQSSGSSYEGKLLSDSKWRNGCRKLKGSSLILEKVQIREQSHGSRSSLMKTHIGGM